MTARPVFSLVWRMWTGHCLLLAARLRKPCGVRILLDDGTEIPCDCAFEGVLDDGEVLWSASPVDGRSVPADRLHGVEVDDLPPGATLGLCADLDRPAPW